MLNDANGSSSAIQVHAQFKLDAGKMIAKMANGPKGFYV